MEDEQEGQDCQNFNEQDPANSQICNAYAPFCGHLNSAPSSSPSKEKGGSTMLSLVFYVNPNSNSSSHPSLRPTTSASPTFSLAPTLSLTPSTYPSLSSQPSTTNYPTDAPSETNNPTASKQPTDAPSIAPSSIPTQQPSSSMTPTVDTRNATLFTAVSPSEQPSVAPSLEPTNMTDLSLS
mmetsp:Transcript_38757/g.66175  ORF Transcript_38757/g.66175 Transcript_38757/m.66175 type:complete len:181 (-) Transcript_38757:111-653(-)